MDCLRMIDAVIPAIDFCMGLKRPRTPGIPKYAWWSFPAIFWKFLCEILPFFRMDIIVLKVSFAFFEGSWMVYFVPSIIHPKISFT